MACALKEIFRETKSMSVMRKLYIQLFKPSHFAFVYIAVILFHVFAIALRPLALPLFERYIVDGKFLEAGNIGRI